VAFGPHAADAMAEVLHLFYCLRHRLPMKEVDEVEAVCNKGFRYCAHGRPGSTRQLLLMAIEDLVDLGLLPGMVKENLTTRGLKLGQLKRGQRLSLGSALVEIIGPCQPCGRMDELRPGLQEALRGRRGVLCRVVAGGIIRRGDRIELVPFQPVSPSPLAAV
jgi:MOSC domain-containing protein YiiM